MNEPPAQFHEAFICDSALPLIMDRLWAAGWRHFGNYFFRYSTQESDDGSEQRITPLRIRVADFRPSKSQRRVWMGNSGLRHEIAPVRMDDDLRSLFQKHKTRFRSNVPESIEDFLGDTPERGPCVSRMLRVFDGERLLAASFFDVGAKAASSVYAMFDPSESNRRLGTYTLLLEVDFCRMHGLEHLYTGYATQEHSAYDYKKLFRPSEWLEWGAGWKILGDGSSVPI